MKLIKWQVKDKIIELPCIWTKKQVMEFLNTDIRICNWCKRTNIKLDHFTNCTLTKQALKKPLI